MKITVELDDDEIKNLSLRKQVYGSSNVVTVEDFFKLCTRGVEKKKSGTIADVYLRGIIVDATDEPKARSKLTLVGSIMKLSWKTAYPAKRKP